MYYPSTWRSTGLVVGNTYTAFLIGWSTRIDGNTPLLGIDPNYTDLGSATWNPSTNRISLTAKEPGEISLRLQLKYGNAGVFYTGFYNYQIVPKQGTYYMQNAGTGRYIDVEGPSAVSGAVIQQWEFHTGNQEKWILEHVANSDGYVRLKSAYSNLYMGVDSSNTSLVKQYSTQNDYTLWRINRSSTGNLILLCKATTNALSVPTTSDQLGTDLTQVSYTGDVNYRDEWEMFKIEYVAYAHNYYDKGYGVRYGESDAVAAQKIDLYNRTLSERYMKLLGLSLVVTTPQYYNSPIDLCKGTVNSSNIDTLCSHAGTIHTDRDSVISSFNATHSGNDTTTNILWSCHRIVSTSTSGNINENRSCSWRNGIYLISIYAAYNRDRNTTSVFMHEMNHQYGGDDHYHELADDEDENSCKFKDICSECGDNPRPSSCIMARTGIDISAETVLCSACQQDILAHLNAHHKILG